MSLPRLKGAISGPIRAYRLTVTAAHFSAYGGGEGENEKEAGGGALAVLFAPRGCPLSTRRPVTDNLE